MREEDIKAKDMWRRDMAKLSIDEKSVVIMNIQRLANEIRETVGRPLKLQWEIKGVER